MKTLLAILALTVSATGHAAAPAKKVTAIAANPEVVSLVAAMEKNRGLRCDPLSPYSVEVKRNGHATALYGCNEYDAEGMPMANVTQIEVAGWLQANSFELMSVKFIPVE